MPNPSSFVNWNDYLGANQGAADQESQQLLGATDAQAGQLAGYRNTFVNGATQAGMDGAADPYQGRGGDYSNTELSYGSALEQLRDPGTRQAVMQKQFGSGTALDSALVGAGSGFNAGIDARTSAEASNKGAAEGMINQRFGDAQQGSKLMADYNAQQAQRAQATQNARQKDAAGQKYAEAQYDKSDNTKGWSKQQRDADIMTKAQGGGWQYGTDGQITSNANNVHTNNGTSSVDWDAFNGGNDATAHQAWENRPKTFWGGDMPFTNNTDPTAGGNDWNDYWGGK